MNFTAGFSLRFSTGTILFMHEASHVCSTGKVEAESINYQLGPLVTRLPRCTRTYEDLHHLVMNHTLKVEQVFTRRRISSHAHLNRVAMDESFLIIAFKIFHRAKKSLLNIEKMDLKKCPVLSQVIEIRS